MVMKNLKKLLFCLLTVLTAVIILTMFACNKNSAEQYKKFDSFPGYENFAEGVVAIEVYWYSNEPKWIEFTVDDTEQVNHVVDLYANLTMERLERGFYIGDNYYIDFVYEDGAKISVSLHVVEYDGYSYSYQTSTIRDYIKQIGKDRGFI